ncbi:MAG: hypothetical protein JEY96_19285 [Bacteroidales bacterium]|nr:hypothetical protein [Bacteroidales bacterium]
MNLEDINSVIEHSEMQIKELAGSIEKNKINKVLLKNTLENLRSILDYLAVDMSSYLNDSKEKLYFPYGRKENHFKLSVKRNLPELRQKSEELYEVLEKRQPFKSKKSWLIDLCELTNEAKHNNLNKTSKSTTTGLRVGNLLHVEDVSNVKISASNNYVNGKRCDDFEMDKGVITSINPGEINLEFTSNEKIRFQGKEIEIISFLETTKDELIDLKKEVYNLIS